jgi:type I restriction enzyme S subunit
VLPLPPLAEQRRIVAAVEALLARVQAARARLAKVPALLKRFRQSVLAAACCGELTADWRERNPATESAAEMVHRVHQQRAAAISQSSKSRHDSRDPISRTVEGLPDTWCQTRIGDIADCLDSLRVPVNREARQTRVGTIPYYGANGQVGWIDEFLFDEDLVLVVEDESFIGREKPFSYVIRGESWVNNHAHVLRLLGGGPAEYLDACLAYYDFIPLTSGTTGRRKLNKGTLLDAELPIAPLHEQHEIVRRVEALFALADKIEARVAAATARVEKITQAILAKAFRGELVPTEAELARQEGRDYEPASVLLERIRAERESGPASTASGSRRRSSKKRLSD